MVERVARVICESAIRRKLGNILAGKQGKSFERGIAPGVDMQWKHYQRDALAAIEAMRTPTEAMWAGADDELDLMDPHWAEKLWQRMISAAISEHKQGK